MRTSLSRFDDWSLFNCQSCIQKVEVKARRREKVSWEKQRGDKTEVNKEYLCWISEGIMWKAWNMWESFSWVVYWSKKLVVGAISIFCHDRLSSRRTVVHERTSQGLWL